MGFLAPWMLFGAAAVSVPIVLHLFFRSRYRTVPWAAMQFLLTSVEQTSRRLKFQELLLLLLRCLVLAMLALAMARPISSALRGTGRGDAVDAVFIMDVSYSMSASDGETSRLGRAKAAAAEIIDKLPPHSTIQIIASSDRAAEPVPRSASNLDDGKKFVQNTLGLTSLATDLFPAVREAKKVFEHGQLSNKELYIFSDMQKLGWDQEASNLQSELKEIKDKAGVFLVRCGTRAPKNAAIVGITPQAGVPRPGERIGFAVLVRNTGSEELEEVSISLTSDTSAKGEDKERTETQLITFLKPGETRPVTLTAKFEKAGPRILTARIKSDELPGDNRYDQVIPVRDTVNVLVVNGGGSDRDVSKSSTFFLNHALLPIKDSERGRYFLQLREVEPRLATRALLAKTDLVFLVNAGVIPEDKRGDGAGRRSTLPSDFVHDLSNWVKQGRGLVIIPGDNTQADAYNRVLGDLLPLPIARVREHDIKKPVNLDRGTFTLPAFMKFKEDRYFAGFNDVQAIKTLDLTEPKTAEGSPSTADVVLRFNNGLPAIARKRVENGEVFLLASAADPAWSDLPLSIEFIPFIQTLFAHLLQEQTQEMNGIAGQAMTWYPNDKELRNYNLQTPSGEIVRLGIPVVKDKRQILTLPEMANAGIYRLLARTATQEESVAVAGVPLAIVPDLKESENLESLTDEEIDRRLGFRPVHLTAGGDLSGTSNFDRFQQEWTLWFLLAVLALAVCESWLAWMCGRAW